MIEVLEPGPAAFVEDLGRIGWAHLGVGRSGAADRGALVRANRLLGNPAEAAGIEVTLGGLRVRFDSDALVVLTGAPAPATLAGAPVGGDTVLRVRPGDELRLGVPVRGLRTYLGVRGGVAVPAVLGSRSWDVLARLGPPPLRGGDRLGVGSATGPGPVAERAFAPVLPVAPALSVLPGLRDAWFAADAWHVLTRSVYRVATDSNRVAVRLEGPVVPRRAASEHASEFASEGLVRGAVQVPPSGQPVVFLSDHPVTGGYPVLGVVTPGGVDALAQVRPGDAVALQAASGALPGT